MNFLRLDLLRLEFVKVCVMTEFFKVHQFVKVSNFLRLEFVKVAIC